MIKDHTEVKPISISKNYLNKIYSLIEKQLDIKLSAKGKITVRKDINRYLLINNNDVNKTLEYFKNYRENLKKLYLGYSDESLNNMLKSTYR
jgi:hypothetical protein